MRRCPSTHRIETPYMQEHSHAFLKTLLETPSPSGFEQAIQEVVRGWARHYADEVRTDRHGNVIAVRHPAGKAGDAGHRVMLAGHCDQIALMVQHIDDNGFLYVQPIGGWDMQILLGQYLTVWTKQRAGHRRRVAPGTAPADQRGAQQGAAVHRRLGRHRRQGPQGGRGAGDARRPGHVRPGLSAAAQRPGRLAGHGRQGRACGW